MSPQVPRHSSAFTTELKVPPEPAFSNLIGAFAADAARRAALTEPQACNIAAAAEEGFNAIVQEALAQEREPIRVVATVSPIEFTLSFFERGLPMDDAFARRSPKWNQLCEAVDSAHWFCHGMAGSELRLTVTREDGTRAAAACSPAEAVSAAPQQEYTIRRFVPADAPGIARAFYLTYGYDYDLSAVYAPARLIELNRSHRYISIVAVAATGDVVGHYALVRDADSPIADAAGAIVVPAHRGRDLLNRLRNAAEQEAIALGLAAYYSEPVTDHPRTQSASENFGAKACGITLGEAPRSFVARHMTLSTTTQRQSCMLYIKPLRAREPRTIYPPQRHHGLITQIYGQLGLPVVIGDAAAPNGRGSFHTEITRSDEFGSIEIDEVGIQTGQLVGQAAEDLRSTNRLGVIYASLPLEDPGTPALCEEVESCGFFFSGVGPWMLDGKDALRMQMPLTAIDLSELVVIGEFGKILLDYIAAERARIEKSR